MMALLLKKEQAFTWEGALLLRESQAWVQGTIGLQAQGWCGHLPHGHLPQGAAADRATREWPSRDHWLAPRNTTGPAAGQQRQGPKPRPSFPLFPLLLPEGNAAGWEMACREEMRALAKPITGVTWGPKAC